MTSVGVAERHLPLRVARGVARVLEFLAAAVTAYSMPIDEEVEGVIAFAPVSGSSCFCSLLAD